MVILSDHPYQIPSYVLITPLDVYSDKNDNNRDGIER